MKKTAVLILSEAAGCFEEIKEGTIPVNPYDISKQLKDVYQAITMDENERGRRLKT